MARVILHPSLSFSMALVAFLLAASAQAQNTTGSMRVEVTDDAGNALGNVPITILHLPTGQTLAYVTNAEGAANAHGLLVGGPYEVSIPPDSGYAADKVEGIDLELDKTEVISMTARAVTFEEISVTAEAVGAELEIGVAQNFTSAQIDAIPRSPGTS
jgi:hypothetical protein